MSTPILDAARQLLMIAQNLSSNPKGPLDDAVTEKFSKNKPATRAEE
jgi:hypothetical protein